MNRIVLWSAVAGTLAIGGILVGANADGLGTPQNAAAPTNAVLNCPSPPQAAGTPAQTLADASGGAPAATASGPADTALQLARRWRQEVVGWFGEMTQGLHIEFRYPEDPENGPVDRDDRPHPSGEA
jgi:hypothetical protein